MGSSQSSQRRSSKEYPLIFARSALEFGKFYEQQKKRMVDIPPELWKIPSEIQRIDQQAENGREVANQSLAVGAVSLAGLATSAAPFFAAGSALAGATGVVLHLVSWVRHQSQTAAVERKKQSLISEFSQILMSLTSKLEQLEKYIEEGRNVESDLSRVITLNSIRWKISAVKPNINNFNGNLRKTEDMSRPLLIDTVSELDHLVTLLQSAVQNY